MCGCGIKNLGSLLLVDTMEAGQTLYGVMIDCVPYESFYSLENATVYKVSGSVSKRKADKLGFAITDALCSIKNMKRPTCNLLKDIKRGDGGAMTYNDMSNINGAVFATSDPGVKLRIDDQGSVIVDGIHNDTTIVRGVALYNDCGDGDVWLRTNVTVDRFCDFLNGMRSVAPPRPAKRRKFQAEPPVMVEYIANSSVVTAPPDPMLQAAADMVAAINRVRA